MTWARPATLELTKNAVRTDLKYISIGFTKPEPWYISTTGYGEIISVQQNYFGFLKFKTVDGKVDFAFSCSDNEPILEELKRKGLDSSKFLPSKKIPKYIQLFAVLLAIGLVVLMVYIFLAHNFIS